MIPKKQKNGNNFLGKKTKEGQIVPIFRKKTVNLLILLLV